MGKKDKTDYFTEELEQLKQENERLKLLVTSANSSRTVDSDSTLESFFNISLDLLCIADTQGNFIRVNKSWEVILGYSSSYLESHKFLDFVHPDDMQATLAAMAKLSDQESVLNFVNRYKSRDGSWRYIEWRSHPSGNLIYAAARDITDRIKSEEELQKSEKRFSLVIDATELGIWDWDVQTNVVYYSPQWKKQLGYEDHELVNDFKTWQDLLHPDDYDRMQKEVADFLFRPSEHFVAEFRLKHKNGTYVWIHNKASALRDQNGKVLRFFGAHSDITERKRAEIEIKEKNKVIEAQNAEYKELNRELVTTKEAIEKSEKKFRNLVESAFDGIYLLVDRTFNYVNPRFTEITGYSYEDLTSENFDFSLLLTDKAKEIVEKRYEARKSGQDLPASYEFEIVTKNGEVKDVEVTTVLIESEKQILVMGIMKDITQRLKMQKEIDYQTKLQSLLNKLAARFINIPPQNVDQEIKEALREMGEFSQVDRVYIFDYNFEKDTMSNTYEWCSPGISEEIQNLQNIPNSSIPEWVELHKSGEVIHIPDTSLIPKDQNLYKILEFQGIKSLVTIPMLNANNCLGFVGFDSVKSNKYWSNSEMVLLRLFAELLVNVQIKTRYEESLRASKILAELKQTEIRNIIDYSPIGIVLISPQGNVIDVNESAVSLLGSPSCEATKKINIFNVNTLREIGFIDDFEKTCESRQMRHNESNYKSIWGKEIFVKYYLVPLIVNGNIESIIANIEDITQIKVAEKNLIMLKEKAEESDRLKSSFLANMSHEIRTPMNAICGFSNLLLNKSISDEQKEEFVEIININSQQLLGIINDIIDVSKIESGQITVSITKFSINELLNETHTSFASSIRMKGLSSNISFGLSDSDCIISSDETKIKQILNNLIYNAIKFTEKGNIEIGYKTKDGFVEFFVKDSGIGIKPENFDLIFQRFLQVDDANTQSRRGTGLGLPISKAFAELLGGNIWLTSTYGQGSCFYFTIPYVQAEKKSNQIEPNVTINYRWNHKTILIAEDDHPNFMYLRELIRSTGATILRAKNGQEAIHMSKETQIDLILMDIKMPLLNGFEATAEIRKLGNKVPIIAQTAYAFSDDKDRAIASGCNDYVSKPIRKDDLLSLIAKWIG